MKKAVKILALILAFMCISLPATAYASDIGSGYATGGSGGFDYSEPDSGAEIFGIEPVSTEDLSDRLNEKGNDVVDIVTVIGKWVCIIMIAFGFLCILIGAFGNQKLLVRGLIAVVLCGVCYAGIVCGRDIVEFIASWAAS